MASLGRLDDLDMLCRWGRCVCLNHDGLLRRGGFRLDLGCLRLWHSLPVVLGIRRRCAVADRAVGAVPGPPFGGCRQPVGLVVKDLLSDVCEVCCHTRVVSGSGASGDRGTHGGGVGRSDPRVGWVEWLVVIVERSSDDKCLLDSGCGGDAVIEVQSRGEGGMSIKRMDIRKGRTRVLYMWHVLRHKVSASQSLSWRVSTVEYQRRHNADQIGADSIPRRRDDHCRGRAPGQPLGCASISRRCLWGSFRTAKKTGEQCTNTA